MFEFLILFLVSMFAHVIGIAYLKFFIIGDTILQYFDSFCTTWKVSMLYTIRVYCDRLLSEMFLPKVK